MPGVCWTLFAAVTSSFCYRCLLAGCWYGAPAGSCRHATNPPRRSWSERTTQFMQNQLEAARGSLALQEAKIRDFQGAHIGELPTQQTTNLQILGGLQAQYQSEQQALNTAKQQRIYIQTSIDQYRTLQ